MLELFSEPFSATGGLAGEGATKLLGTPNLSPVEVLVRETAQNSIDAARPGCAVEYSVLLRRLNDEQRSVLNAKVLNGLPACGESRRRITTSLTRQELNVLEVRDRGTWGLGGPTSPDVIPENVSSLDFVNFVRNIGAGRDRPGGGGTYGFGKTAAYAFSSCSTVVIYSRVALDGGSVESRLMACHLGNEFGVKEKKFIKKYTGRHWWGLKTEHGVDPLLDEGADFVARSLGVSFAAQDTGTSLLIIDPEIDDEETFEGRLKEAMLFHLWPKMVTGSNGAVPVKFVVGMFDKTSLPPRPEEFPPLHAYAKCLKQIRDGGDGVSTIKCGKPKVDLGKLALSKFERLARKQLVPKDISLFSENMSHIALMRPVELVVTYREGKKDPSGDIEWGGVFICNRDEEIESAFARAEPPSHDDWQPKNLKDKRFQTLVRVALREIDRSALTLIEDFKQSAGGGGADVHLGKLADQLGILLPGFRADSRNNGQTRIPKRKPRGKRSDHGRASGLREVELAVDGVEDKEDGRIVTLTLTNLHNLKISELHAAIAVSVDGRPAPGWLDEIDNGSRVIGWYSADNRLVSETAKVKFTNVTAVSKLKVFVTNAAVEIEVHAKVEEEHVWE